MAVALTTKDNPFDPIDEFDQWLAFDHAKGYYTNEYLSRIRKSSDALSEAEQDSATLQAIRSILAMDNTIDYVIVRKDND